MAKKKGISGRGRSHIFRPFLVGISLLVGMTLTAGLLLASGSEKAPNQAMSTETNQPNGGWTTVFTETFESGISAGWQVTDTNGPTNGDYYWAATNVTSSQGMTSVWATGGGADGALLTPLTDDYPNNATSLMVYGPISLSGTTAVSLTYDYWLETQPLSDTFETLLSINGISFTPQAVFSGTTPSWQSTTLNLNSYANRSQVWLAFSFHSDAMTTARGVFLDNINLDVQYGAISGTVYLPVIFNPPDPIVTPAWLEYFNLFRQNNNLPMLSENADWSNGDWLHSRYMVKNDYVGHTESSGNPWYTPEGLAAAQNGNVFVTSWLNAPDETAIDFWMAAPFHNVSMMDPRLATTGLGSYRENIGSFQMAATLDVSRGRTNTPAPGTYPLPYPRNGGQTWLTRYNGGEFPDPLSPCPGYTTPTGPPLILQLGTGSITPNVTAASLTANGTPKSICVYDETNYVNSDSGTQSSGRIVLNVRDAIVIMPRDPLVVGQNYAASITVNGQTINWSFTVTTPPIQQPLMPEGLLFEYR
ncbi:MAG: CAP domain-containing protein [Candidatus Promineifilaceae bacterium]